MSNAVYHNSSHVSQAEPVTQRFNYRGDAEPTRYRWSCSCGKSGKGSHPTPEKALAVSQDHVTGKPVNIKPLTNEQKFRRGVTLLADRGFTRDEIWQTTTDLYAAFRQGVGLCGEQMTSIIDEALEPHSLHAEARALFEADPSSRMEADWHNLADYKRDGWYDIAVINRVRNAQKEES